MFGNYDQCLNATVFKRSGAVDFRGQYCLISAAAHLPKPEITPDTKERVALVKKLTQNLTEVIRFYAFTSEILRPKKARFGLCVPSGCDTSDVDKLVKYAGKKILMNLTLDFCDTEDSLIYFTPSRIAILCIYSFFILLVIVSSVIERYSTARNIKFESPVMRGLLCFSLPYNFHKFASTEVREGNLSFLNGIRVLSLFWIILGHHYVLKLESFMMRNAFSMFIFTWVPRFFFQILLSVPLAVDAFFFIGGFLNCYIRAKKNFTIFSLSSSFMILIHRLMRIYPVLIFCTLVNFLMNPRGPMVHSLKESFWEPCRTQWWKNILFINNIYDIDQQCVPHSWYLAADMQLFLVALFSIPLLFRHLKIGVLVNLAIIFLSIAYTFVRVWAGKFPPAVVVSMDSTNVKDFMDNIKIHFLPFPHAPSYFGGVLLGFFVAKKKSLKISKITQIFGWIAASAVFLTMLFTSKKWNSGYPYTRLESAVFFSLHRPLYSWSVGWLIFCCFAGHGGFINYILSWKVWIPFNRLCLSAYLLSVILQLNYFGNLRSPQDFQTEVEIWGYFGDITVTCLLAVPIVLVFESPFIALEKVIFLKKENSSFKIRENEMNGKEIIQHEKDAKSDNEDKAKSDKDNSELYS